MLELNKIHCADCIEGMKQLPDNSVDSLVTDPPAGICFMGKEWDGDKGGRDNWIVWLTAVMTEAKRVLKPGGHAFVWALPRTSHWTAMALENAGFEIRDCVYHIFGSGFPKSLNIGKQEGCEQWDGWGTNLKPAVECWWLCRKPLSEKTIAENVLKWGTGGLNIGECRIKTEDNLNGGAYGGGERCSGDWKDKSGFKNNKLNKYEQPQGRFPSHLIHDGSDEVLSEFAKAGESVGEIGRVGRKSAGNYDASSYKVGIVTETGIKDFGTPARFFYCAKASRSERDEGLEGITPQQADLSRKEGNPGGDNPRNRGVHEQANFHPTVKPLALMKYLIKLITPPNGVVLDPFIGSGTTAVACRELTMRFVGFEISQEYVDIANARLKSCMDQTKLSEVIKS